MKLTAAPIAESDRRAHTDGGPAENSGRLLHGGCELRWTTRKRVRQRKGLPRRCRSLRRARLLAGMVAAWLAAGSVGLLGGPLRHVLIWLSLAVAVLAGLTRQRRTARNRLVLTAGLALGLLFTAPPSPVVNVLAVAVVFARVVAFRSAK